MPADFNRPSTLEPEFFFVTRRLVMYSDLNAHGLLFGGQLMSWLDEGTAQTAMRLMGTDHIVTKKFGEIVFEHPGRLGDSLEIWARVEREGRTSLTLECRVFVRRFLQGVEDFQQICRSNVVYVALDAKGRPRPWNRPAGG
jgi:acyl-CoA thioesterase YciA